MSLQTPQPKQAALLAILLSIPGNTNLVQCKRIRAALAQFSITTFEAMRYLDIYDPRARVMQLRNEGLGIDTHWRTIETESGAKHRVGLYALKVGAA